MKANLVRKYKWYIFGAIAVILIMSIGLSFCAWDSNALNNISMNGSVADYKPYTLVVDDNNNGMADVGDIVTYGRYYQQANETTKTDLRWIVADIRKENDKNVMYLLTEKVVAFGTINSYCWYYDDDGILQTFRGFTCPRYDDSTIRAWLNSDDVSVDPTVNFKNPSEDKHVVYKGFYNEAFSSSEKDMIIARDIGAMKGAGYNDINSANKDFSIKEYEGVNNQKVWIPSFTEIFGKVDITGTVDGISGPIAPNDFNGDSQLSYFNDNDATRRIANTTLFASSVTAKGLAHYNLFGVSNNPLTYGVERDTESPANWWLRTPNALQPSRHLSIKPDGSLNLAYTAFDSRSAVRPAICLEK